jgi:hypothetical protein
MMDIDTTINGLAHELWAIAQGVAPIEDVVTPMMAELQRFERSKRDCRVCHYFTTKGGGCASVFLCVDSSRYTPTTPRQYWTSAAEALGVLECGPNVRAKRETPHEQA